MVDTSDVWRRWPSWVGGAAAGVAALYGLVVVVVALLGERDFVGLPQSAGPAAGLLLAGALVAGLPPGRLPRRVVAGRCRPVAGCCSA